MRRSTHPFLALIGLAPLASAADIHVPADQPTIQAAVSAASSGDVVILTDGVYTGAGNRDVSFLGKAITVRSANGPAACIINCQDSGRGFLFGSGETGAAKLEGVTIVDGKSWDFGGAVYIQNSSPTIRNCTFYSCEAPFDGGAVYSLNGNPTISDCAFNYNTAGDNGGGFFGLLGGVAIGNSTFSYNTAGKVGGGAMLSQATYAPSSIARSTTARRVTAAG